MQRADAASHEAGEGDPVAPRLVLYSREYCHLCEDMLVGLRQLGGPGFSLEIVDVDSDPELEARYGEWVPLLLHGETELSRYHLDPARVRAYLNEIR